MLNRITSLAACALICASVYADDRAPSYSNPCQNGSDATVKRSIGDTAANLGHAPIHGGSKNSARSPDFPTYGPSILTVGAREVQAIPKLSRFAGSNATAGNDPASGPSGFLLPREPDTGIRLLTTNVALRFKLSADGVHLTLAF